MKYNRWYAVIGALLIQVSLGAIYIYSVFKPALKEHFPAWSATDLALPAQTLLFFEALSMIIAGRLQDRIGPKKISIFGAIFPICFWFWNIVGLRHRRGIRLPDCHLCQVVS